MILWLKTGTRFLTIRQNSDMAESGLDGFCVIDRSADLVHYTFCD